jgi:tetratricopeptide (TPR) repeat protein
MVITEVPTAIRQRVANPKDPLSWINFVIENEVEIAIEDQIACFQQAVVANGTEARAWYCLACAYELQGKDWFGATNAWNQVVFLDRDNATAWQSLSQLWAHRGMMGKARECLAECERIAAGANSRKQRKTK